MSSPLAIAAVTATMCDLLNNGLVDHDLSAVGSFSVTAVPPDRVETGSTETNRLNLFLYQVTPNPGWRNVGEPSRDARDPRVRLSNPPLALDLHYMLTAYGSADWAAEVLLGFGMEVLHEARVLTRQNIRDALASPSPVTPALIPKDPQGRSAIDLADQIELVKIAPHYLSADELSRLWTAMQAKYRPTMAYQVSTVLIQSTRPTRAPLPVLSRGDRDTGVQSQPDLLAPGPSAPTIASIGVLPATAGEQRSRAEQGDTLEINGAHLDGDAVVAEFHHPLLAAPIERNAVAGSTATRVLIVLPQSNDPAAAATFEAGADAKWPAGLYVLTLRIAQAGKPTRRTNAQPFGLAPRLTNVTVAGAGAALRLDLRCFPQVMPSQQVEIFVGAEPFTPKAFTTKTSTLSATIASATRSENPVPVTLRVDGVDSELVRDRSAQPPQFDRAQKVTLPL
jgi:hypothetical protein